MDVAGRLTPFPRDTALVVGLVSGSHVINHLYLVLFPPILTTLAADFEVGLGALGVAMGVQAFVNAALQMPYGYLADNYDRSLPMALCLGLGATGAGVLALAPTFEWLLVGQAVLGAGVAGHHPAHFPLLSDATAEGRRGRAYSVHGFAGNLGFAAPPVVIVGVTAIPGASWRHAFGLVAAVSAVYGLVATYLLRYRVSDAVTRPNPSEDADRAGATSPVDRLRAEVAALVGTPSVLALGVVVFLAATAFWGVTSYVAVFLEKGYGVAPDVASLTLTAMFVLGAGLILLGGTIADRVRPGPVLAAAQLLVALFTFGLAARVVPPMVAIGIAALAGSLGSLGAPARDKLTDTLSARGDIGRNFAIITVGLMTAGTVAPPVFGALIEAGGYGGTFLLIGLVALTAALATVALVVRFRDDLDRPVPTPSGD